MSCPYGMWYRDRQLRMERAFQCLTNREREYMMGLSLDMHIYYHKLDSRMYEISMQMALCSEETIDLYYLRTMDHVQIVS